MTFATKNRWLKAWLVVLGLWAAAAGGFAQSDGGIIVGTVTDSWQGNVLPGVTVLLRGTTLGTATDGSGRFRLEAVPEGRHILLFSKSGYTRSSIGDVWVISGQTSTANLELKPEFFEMEPYVFVSPSFVDQGVELLRDRQSSAAMIDAIGSEFFSRAGAGNAAEIMTKVTGASVVGGKYVFIRGLGDRYSNTMLNGAEVPSPDPDRRAVQMDIFPSSAIDNIVTVKTFTPDKPGSFSGGSVDIITKSFPDTFQGKVSVGATYNPQVSFQDDYLSYEGGRLDFLGFDDGTRAIPGAWGEAGSFDTDALAGETRSGGGRTLEYRTVNAEEVIALTKSFTPVMTASRERSPMKHDFFGSLGDTFELWKRRFGYFVGVSYERDYSFYTGGFHGRYNRSGDRLQPFMELDDAQAVESVSWGSLVNLAWELSERHEVGFNFLYNRNSEDQALQQEGFLFGLEPDTFERQVLAYTQRELQSYQLRGEHELENWKIEWISSLSTTMQDQPDLRLFQFQRRESGTIDINLSGYQAPTRYFRGINEDNRSFKLDNTYSFPVWNELEAKVKFGGFFSGSNRSFAERRFEYVSNSSPRFLDLNLTGDEEAFLEEENLVYLVPSRGVFGFNKYVVERPFNDYEGFQDVYAGYLMTELPIFTSLKAIGGVRYETTDLGVDSTGEREGTASLQEASVLPALGAIYELAPEMNFRLSYGRTLARPTYREITPISVFDVVNRETLVGNPDLSLTAIDNFDLRWEWFPGEGEVLAASVFYKALTDPIQKTTATANRQVQYQNREKGIVYGLELEARKTLDFIREELAEFTLGGNFAYVESEVDKGPFDYGEDLVSLAGQSSYIVNFDLTYHNEPSATTVSLFYNVFGPRLYSVGQRETPHIFERPVHSVDFSLSKGLSESWTVKLSAKNLLDPLIKTTYEFGETEYRYRVYRRGRSFGVSLTYEF